MTQVKMTGPMGQPVIVIMYCSRAQWW